MVQGPVAVTHRGGGGGGMAAPARKAEILFETSTIIEIREVEAKAKVEIEEKKAALRLLVGNSYRDLISSADSILAMANTCAAAVDNIASVQVGLSQLAHRLGSGEVATTPEASSVEAAAKREELYAVGARVKFLVDSPETLWGHLDAQDFLQAACRFLRAQQVHEVIEGPALKVAMRRFPLIGTQWPHLSNFRGSIVSSIRRQLSETGDLTSNAAAEALTAVALLEEQSSRQALELFLAMRQEHLKGRLGSDESSFTGDSDGLSGQLANIATGIQDTIAQIGEIFLRPLDGQRGVQPLLTSAVTIAAAADSGGGGELTASCLKGTGTTPSPSETEMWQELMSRAEQELTPLPQQAAAPEATTWLNHLIAAVMEAAPELLSPAKTPRQLADTEEAVRKAVSSWGEDRLGGWSVVAETVLGQNCDLWFRVFEPAFIDRSKWLIAAAFSEAEDALKQPLATALHAAASQPAAPAGTFCSRAWPPSAAEGSQIGWRQNVEEARAGFDAKLAAALEGTLLLSCPSVQGNAGGGVSMGARGGISARGLLLQPYVRDRGLEAGMAAARQLQLSLAAVVNTSASAASEEGTATRAEAILAVARLSNDLSDRTSSLQVIVGDPVNWLTDGDEASWRVPRAAIAATPRWSTASAPSSRAGSSRTEAAGRGSNTYQEMLSKVKIAALEWWAAWAASAICAKMLAALSSDVALLSDNAMRGWQETVVPADSDDVSDGGESGSMKFLLPSAPSPALLAALLAANREADRAGGYTAPTAALELLTWHLEAGCLTVFSDLSDRFGGKAGDSAEGPFGKRGGSTLTERGTLQLLFDCAIVRRVLSGGRPAGSFAAASSASRRPSATLPPPEEDAERQQQWAGVEERLQGRLDPIDWATYEPHLADNAAAFCRGAGVLLGTLLQLSRLHSPADKVQSAHSGIGNGAAFLSVAPKAERFAYLPVSVSAAVQASLQRGPSPSSLLNTSGRGGDEDDDSYSFADLMGNYAAWGKQSDASPSNSSARNEFEAAQSRAGARLGALGSLLGDKAAEAAGSLSSSLSVNLASAAGSTGLGNYLQPASASSLLTSIRSRWQTQ